MLTLTPAEAFGLGLGIFLFGCAIGAWFLTEIICRIDREDMPQIDAASLESMRRETYDRWRDNRVEHVQD